MRISDWSSDVCSSDLANPVGLLADSRCRTTSRIERCCKAHRMLHREISTLARMLLAREEAGGGEVRVVHDIADVAHRMRRDLHRMAFRNQLRGREGRGQSRHLLTKKRQVDGASLTRRKKRVGKDLEVCEQGEVTGRRD